MSNIDHLSDTERVTLDDPIFAAVLTALPVCCEDCRVDPEGRVWQDALLVRDALVERGIGVISGIDQSIAELKNTGGEPCL